MDMQTSTMPPKGPTLTVEDDVLASQVLEIIGGMTLEALQMLEDPEEREVWLMEEGDDSVFYSDEDIKANASCDHVAGGCEHLIDSVTADEPIPQEEDDQREGCVLNKGDSEKNSEKEKEVTRQVAPNEQVEERQEIQTPKTESMDQSDAAEPGQSNRTLEKLVSTCRESLQLNCTSADMQTRPEQNLSAEKVNLPAEEEEVVPNTQTADLEPFDVPNEESIKRLNVEPKVSEQMSSAQLQISRDRKLQVDRDVHVPMGFHQNSSPGYSTLPLPKKSSQEKSFNHLTSTKYSTVSYRKIRRGNTRQKIETFEYMLMNL